MTTKTTLIERADLRSLLIPVKREYEIKKLPDGEIRRRMETTLPMLERLQLMREHTFRNMWTKPPTRRPWTALADKAPSEDEPVLWWAPGGFTAPGTFEEGSVFVATYSASERRPGYELSKWDLTESGSHAEDGFPCRIPTHWRPLPSIK